MLGVWLERIGMQCINGGLVWGLVLLCTPSLWASDIETVGDHVFFGEDSPLSPPLETFFQLSGSVSSPRSFPLTHVLSGQKTVGPKDTETKDQLQSEKHLRWSAASPSHGRTAFETTCTQCHDAQRSLQKQKSLSGWRATVRRMAAKDGADVWSGDFEAIAIYLALFNMPANHKTTVERTPDSQGISPNNSNAQNSGDTDRRRVEFVSEIDDVENPVTVSATISTLFRGAENNHSVENEGFFADVWVGLDWQPQSPVSGRVVACTSCHSEDTSLMGGGFSFELVEASATLDLIRLVCGKPSTGDWEAKVKGGRFIAPFGAFAAMSHPGVYRTLTNPLMYNMGRRAFGETGLAGPPRQPVLPMPYADEGMNFQAKIPLMGKTSAKLDLYGVNGLQQSGPDLRFFSASRSYVDNNSLPAVGGRLSVGNSTVRFGGSYMTGEAQPSGTPTGPVIYQLSGADFTARFKDFVRVYLEYAIRTNTKKDSPFSPAAERRTMVYGVIAEAEVKLFDKPQIGLLGRFDTLEFRDTLFPGTIQTEPSLERLTWGFNLPLPGGSLLILNHEHWNLVEPDRDMDVVGFRWVGTF